MVPKTLFKSRCQKIRIKLFVGKVPYKKTDQTPSKKCPARKYGIDMLTKKQSYKNTYGNTFKKVESERKRFQNARPKTIVQRNCPKNRWRSAIGIGAQPKACQTIAKQTGCQKHRQLSKTEKVGMDVLLRNVP